jgi:hypothetical protein
VAGIVGVTFNSSRIRGSTASTSDPAGARSYLGGPSDRNAARTVFFEIPKPLAIVLIGTFSTRCNRRISAQSSTVNTCFLLTSAEIRLRSQGVSFRLPLGGQFSGAADTIRALT